MWRGPPPTILVVDDDPNIRCILSKGLGRAGYEVRVAEDGDAALGDAGEAMPDLVLLDIVMPGELDGYEVCQIVREDPQLRDMPITFVTGLEADANVLIHRVENVLRLRPRVASA
jgi:CheY-like chemotaxis protein